MKYTKLILASALSCVVVGGYAYDAKLTTAQAMESPQKFTVRVVAGSAPGTAATGSTMVALPRHLAVSSASTACSDAQGRYDAKNKMYVLTFTKKRGDYCDIALSDQGKLAATLSFGSEDLKKASVKSSDYSHSTVTAFDTNHRHFKVTLQ